MKKTALWLVALTLLLTALAGAQGRPDLPGPVRVGEEMTVALKADCSPQAIADAGPDQSIHEGELVLIGTPALPDHSYFWSPGGDETAEIIVSPSATTTYTVIAVTVCGSAESSVTVTVVPPGQSEPQEAVYDVDLRAPQCAVSGSSCDSTTLLDGRAGLGPEPNQPNTVDPCPDGIAGTYHSDESNDRIVVSTLDGSDFREGALVRVDATVWAWATGSSDAADFYYAADATSPEWTYVGTVTPSGGGAQVLTQQYALPAGCLQAVRVNFRYEGAAGSCSTGDYDESDDLVFAVDCSSSCTVDADCDDGLFCNGTETCNEGSCQAGTPPECDDGVSCTEDSCNEGTDSCESVPSSSTCGLLETGCTVCEKGPSAACGCESQNCGGEDASADPVYLFSGEYYESAVDLQIRGRGPDFVWARKYRSRLGPDTLQGNGWDYSYNIRIESSGADLVLFDGNTRQDTYSQSGGVWTAAEFYRELSRNPDGSYTLAFPDTSTWNFNPLDASPQQGKIESVVDRNGNTLRFQYDAGGRLVTITDTLDRDTQVAYNAAGFVESVTDFAGRQVFYEYYQDGDAGGSFGDLKSVRSPTVVGTPNGNDFPAGKTTVYTYTTGFADESLNHNLLTITDPKGQTYLTNVYSATTDPTDVNYDTVQRQVWGNPGDIIDFVYVVQTPSSANNFATLKTIVNDRVGNVKEYFFNGNRNVLQREYTGRADPDQPTTDAANRPTGQLRAGDPAFFEMQWQYNTDARATQAVDSNGNVETFTYDDSNASRRAHGNVTQSCRTAGPLGGDQAMICESFEYDDGFGGCCGTNFVTRHVDGRGQETLHTYDAAGNRTHTQHRIPSIVEDFEYNGFGQLTAHVLPDNGSGQRRRDEYTYYVSGPQRGYRATEVVDALGFALTTTTEYDQVGNVVRVIDPAGHDTQYVVNELDQTVRTLSAAVTLSGGTVRYEHDMFYDANDNLVRLDVQDIDDQGALQANSHFTTVYEYDILNYPTRMCQEVGDYTGAIPGTTQLPTCVGLPDADFLTTEHVYDANRNRTLIRYGEAVEGRQPTNVVRRLYDERDLLFQEIRAEGDPDQSTTQYDYDSNRNPVRTTQGTEGAVPRVTTITYDGYDRLVTATDPMGNVTTVHYDANHNRVELRFDGELVDTAPTGLSNVRLSETDYVYDAMDRLIEQNVAFFDTETGTPLLDGLAKTVTTWSHNSQVLSVTNDNNHTTSTSYDTANRRSVVSDHLNNQVSYVYDSDSLVLETNELERSNLGGADELFKTTNTYDAVHRLTQTVDNVGNTHQLGYDSRDNQTLLRDALSNETRNTYDGANRLLATVRDLDGDGADGDGNDITTQQEWDDTDRLVAQLDDNGNRTESVYDALNRMTSKVYADGTVHQSVYDVHHNRITRADANGSVVNSTYDQLNRLIANDVTTHGPGVSTGLAHEDYQHDGLSRLILAADEDATVTRSYDSLSHVTREILNGETTTCSYDGVGNELTRTYPGGRTITTTYDELERKKVISDSGGMIAQYDYVGPGRVERREYGNGTRTDYTYDGITGVPNPANDFGVKRIVRTRHTRIGDGSVIDDRTYTWDRIYNKTQREDVRVGGPQLTHDYTYDDVYRLTRTVVTDPLATVLRDQIYNLDGVGNRTDVVGGSEPGLYTMDPTAPEPADRPVNQYTTTSFDDRIYDKNGNLVDIDPGLGTERQVVYDYRNQMVEYVDFSNGQRHIYRYDALGRRSAKVVDVDGVGSGPAETRYFYDGWQVCEEQDAGGGTEVTYVYGLYIDEFLNMQRGGVDYYYHTDDLYNVMAVTDTAGSVVEYYEYADYGQLIDPITLASIPGNPSVIGNPHLFTGRHYDLETGWYYYRTRHLDPNAGRFTTRDTIGIWGDQMNVGNAYTYVGNNAWSWFDPIGYNGSEKDVTDKSGKKVGTIDTSKTNCIGYACRTGGSLRPIQEPAGKRTSLEQLMTALGYKCTAGVSALDCKKHCKCEDYMMLYVYIIKTYDFDKVREKYKDKDPFKDPVITDTNELDYHGLRGGADGYTYQPNMADKADENIKDFKPTASKPDYFGNESQMLGKYCCCRPGDKSGGGDDAGGGGGSGEGGGPNKNK